MSEEKKRKNLGTYAVILILAAVFVIIIAAMADNRENLFEDQISQQTEINVGIQNQIVRLEDENYNLKKEIEELNGKTASQEKEIVFQQTLREIYTLVINGNTEEAKTKADSLDITSLTETQKDAYDLMKQQLFPSEETSKND